MPERLSSGRINWLASYPKSGNTWMRMLLANYRSDDGQPHDINARGAMHGNASARWLFDTYLGVASNDLHDAEIDQLLPHLYVMMATRNPAPVWMKVHEQQAQTADGHWRFSPAASGVAIYIIRNPLDVAVSNAFHDGHGDMARAVDKLCDAAMTLSAANGSQLLQHIGDWSAHVLSWVDRSPLPVLVIRYEDMLADAGAALSAVLGFVQPEEALDPVRLARAVEYSRFEALRSAEDSEGFRETPTGATRFFREGRAGTWRAYLSPEQVERIWRHHGPVMQRFGYAIG